MIATLPQSVQVIVRGTIVILLPDGLAGTRTDTYAMHSRCQIGAAGDISVAENLLSLAALFVALDR